MDGFHQTMYDLDLLLRAESIKGNPAVGIFPKKLISNALDILKQVEKSYHDIFGVGFPETEADPK